MDLPLVWIILVIAVVLPPPPTLAACSGGCPAGMYEAQPCSTFGDRVCKPCSVCSGSTYEARPCTANTDRHCMHVAHPLLIAGESTTPSFLEGLKVDATPNVFMEDLHNTRNLETTFYVTDMTQASDFEWKRESGLQVKIGILDVHLIPTYEDVTHESDNKYMLGNPNNSEDKTKFRRITQAHCRNPIPDYYSITLEISRDRTTEAAMLMCDPEDEATPDCPENLNEGDQFLHRTLNEACTKMGTFPEPLEPAANSIVCTENTALLREIFNQTYVTERPIRFPPRRCRHAMSRCEQCLHQSKCRLLEHFQQRCCQIDCYTLPDCKLAQSEQCSGAAVECAMGDAYRYTIQPVYQNIKQEFQCHIQHQRPEVLYELFFYIEIPGTKFITPKVFRTVYAKDLGYQSQGTYQADFVTVEHNTGLHLQDEFILLGRDDPAGSYKMNYSVNSLKTEDDYKKKRVVVHEISHNIFVASTQFERPFDYSTSSWVKDNQCKKDVSKFRNVQKHYNSDPQSVKVTTQAVGAPYKYWLQSNDNAPFIRFLVPGNTSVLPWYFRDVENGPTLLTNDSLHAELELTAGGRIWLIHLTGRMTACPGYLGITINNRLELEELFRYDILVLCPTTFNMTFHVPNFGQSPDRTFDIHLEDSQKSYEIYLTQILFEQYSISTEPEPMAVPRIPETSVTVFAIVGGITILMMVFLLIIYIYTESTKFKVHKATAAQHHEPNYSSAGYYGEQHSPQHSRSCLPSHKLTKSQVLFVTVYIIVRVVYSLVFTFTFFFTLIMLFVQSDFGKMSNLAEFQNIKMNESRVLSHKVNTYGQEELLRQMELAREMQGACSFYIEELFDSLAFQMDNITANQHLLEMYDSDRSSISYLLRQRADHVLSQYQAAIDNFTAGFEEHVDTCVKPSIVRYKRYLDSMYRSDWLSFPQKLFNESSFATERPKLLRSKSQLTGTEVDFGAFLEIEEVEEVQLWPVQFWERFEETMPAMPVLPIPKVDHLHPKCTGDSINISARTPLSHLDSTRYFASAVMEEPSPSSYHPSYSTATSEEQRSAPSHAPRHPSGLRLSSLLAGVDTELLWILFVVLDVLLMVYRSSHTYISAASLCRGFIDSRTATAASMARSASYSTSACTSATNTLLSQKSSGGGGGGGAAVLQQQNGGRGINRSAQRRTNQDPYKHEKEVTFAPDVADYNAPLHRCEPPDYTQQQHVLSPHHSHMLQQQQQPHQVHLPPLHVAAAAAGSIGAVQNGRDFIWRETVSKVLQSDTVARLVVAAALLLLCYCAVAAVCVVMDVEVLVAYDVFSVFLQGLDVQVNQTNWYLADQAAYFNQVTMTIYQGQMRSELLNLQSMLDYFSIEQKRLLENYRVEACAVKRRPAANWTCDVTTNTPRLHVPLLPCNFIPLQSHTFTDFSPAGYVEKLWRDVAPYLSATRHVALAVGYAILVTVCGMLIIHLAGAVVFHYLKRTHKFPVRRSVLLSADEASTGGVPASTCDLLQGSAGAGGDLLPPPPPPHTEESDYDSDDGDGGFRNYPPPMPHGHMVGVSASGQYGHVVVSPHRADLMDMDKSGTLLADFKYSETKV